MILENLKKFIDYKGISIAAFEKSIGMSNNSFRKSLNTGGNLGSDKLENILRVYPELNPGWILTGSGKMLINNNSEDKNAYPNAYPNAYLSHKNKEEGQCNIDLGICETPTELANKFLNNESEISVPFYDLPVSAGSLGILDMNSANITIPAGHIKLPVFRGCEAIFPIIGISMEPLVHSGDWIGIKSIDNLSRSWDFIQTGVIYLIITREDRMIKFIEKSDDDDFIVCSSPNYHSFKVYKGDILSIYRVKAVARGL